MGSVKFSTYNSRRRSEALRKNLRDLAFVAVLILFIEKPQSFASLDSKMCVCFWRYLASLK